MEGFREHIQSVILAWVIRMRMDKEYFSIDKQEWEKTLSVNKKQLLKVALAGALVGAIVASLYWWIYIQTGFVW